MGDTCSIIILPGSKLVLDGGTLTSTCPGELWQGIEVVGDRTKRQIPQWQGTVELKNGAVIENAHCGIYTGLGNDNWHTTGGIIKADSAFFINTARGGLVDEKALVRAVTEGRIAGAGVDCIENMPLTKDDPLLGRENIIVTPHVGGTSNDIATVTIPMLVDTIMDLYRGDKVRFVVNSAALSAAGFTNN